MLLCLGFRIVPTTNVVENPMLLWDFGKKAPQEGGTYVPRPFPTERVDLTGEALDLVDKLGRHTHNVRNWIRGLWWRGVRADVCGSGCAGLGTQTPRRGLDVGPSRR